MMRIAKATGISGLLLALSAQTATAQAYSCYRPDEPRIPSGYSVTEGAVERVEDEAGRYVADMRAYIACVAEEHGHASSELDDFADKIDRFTSELGNR